MSAEFIGLIASAAISFVGIIYSFIISIKKGKNTKSVKLAKILQSLPDLIKNAEEVFPSSGSGPAKSVFVLNQIHMKCLECGVDFDPDEWFFEIENILETPEKK